MKVIIEINAFFLSRSLDNVLKNKQSNTERLNPVTASTTSHSATDMTVWVQTENKEKCMGQVWAGHRCGKTPTPCFSVLNRKHKIK